MNRHRTNPFRSGSITSVMDFFVAKLYRFFFAVRAHCVHGLPLPSPQALRLFIAGHFPGAHLTRERIWPASRYTLLQRSEHRGGLLLSLRDGAGAEWLLQDVRDAEVCVALVGYILQASSAKAAHR